MNLFIYALRDDVSHILSLYSLHDSDETATYYYTYKLLEDLFNGIDSMENKDDFLKTIEERFSHSSLIKIGSLDMVSGDVNNLDNLIVLNNSNMYDYFNLFLNVKERSDNNESNDD